MTITPWKTTSIVKKHLWQYLQTADSSFKGQISAFPSRRAFPPCTQEIIPSLGAHNLPVRLLKWLFRPSSSCLILLVHKLSKSRGQILFITGSLQSDGFQFLLCRLWLTVVFQRELYQYIPRFITICDTGTPSESANSWPLRDVSLSTPIPYLLLT